MPKAAVLFSLRSFPNHALPLDEATNDVAGLAEWFGAVPGLFLLLLGEGQVASCSIATFEVEAFLVAPMHEARGRWQQFRAIAEPLLPTAARGELDRIQAMLDESLHPWLLLDTIELHREGADDAALAARVRQLQAMGAALVAALRQAVAREHIGSEADLPEALRSLVGEWQQQWGWWSAQVIARQWQVEYQAEDERPEFLQALQVEEWSEALGAYIVRPQDTDGAARQGSEEMPVGIVTPYGRWLLPFEAGATSVHPERDHPRWLVASRSLDGQDEATPRSDLSGLVDFNGVWRFAFGSLRYAFVVGANLLWASFVDDPRDDGALVCLRTGDVLHTDLFSVARREDGMLSLWDKHERVAVASAEDGRLVLPFRYAAVGNFDTRKRWAVVKDAQSREGVIDVDGRELVPCAHDFIVRGSRDAPPRIYRGNRFIGIDQRTIILYATDGTRIGGPFFFATDLYAPVVESDRILTLDSRHGPDARVQWIDFDGNLVETTSIGTVDWFTARKKEKSAGRKKRSGG